MFLAKHIPLFNQNQTSPLFKVLPLRWIQIEWTGIEGWFNVYTIFPPVQLKIAMGILKVGEKGTDWPHNNI